MSSTLSISPVNPGAAAPGRDDDIFGQAAPPPLAVFYSRTIHPENLTIEERAKNAALLAPAALRQIRQEYNHLRAALRKAGYIALRSELDDLRDRFLPLLAEYRAQGDPAVAARMNQLLRRAEDVKAQLKVLAPQYRKLKALEARLEDHRAAVEREKIHAQLRRKMSKEVVIHAQTVVLTWGRLGYKHEYTHKNKLRRQYVRFADCVVTPDNIQLKIYVSRLGLFGGSVPVMPAGVAVADLVDPRTLYELSIACERQVTAQVNPISGAWIVIHRLGLTDGLLDKVHYEQVMNHYPVSERQYLPICLGVAEGRHIHWIHLSKHPHMLIGGSTGNGKSNFINSLICTYITQYSPAELQLVLVDLKEGLEFSDYKEIPHLLTPVVEEVDQLAGVLAQIESLRRERGQAFQRLMARDISEYNARALEPIPHIVIIIDEYASINSDKKQAAVIQNLIMQLVNKGRAVGVHVIICTQNPSVDIVTGSTKANLAARLAFQMPTKPASQTILGVGDAADLAPIPGRAMAMIGSRKWAVQTPLVKPTTIQNALNIARAYDPAPITLPAPTVASAGFTEDALIRTVIEFMNCNLGARPIYDFVKNDEDVSRNQIADMIGRIIDRGEVVYNGVTYDVAMKGKGYILKARNENPIENPL